MIFEKSTYFNQLTYKKLVFPFGKFYLFDNFVISELNEGIHFDWGKIQELSVELISHYGYNISIAYISNRIHSHSIDPHLWTNFNKEFGFIVANAVVVYDDISYMNATLEKQFTGKSLKRCSSLEEAIHWVQNLDEFKM